MDSTFGSLFLKGRFIVTNSPLSNRLTAFRESSRWMTHGETVFKYTVNGIPLALDRFTSVGRNGEIVIYEDIPWVSRKHLELLANRNGDVWVRDTNSKAGTYINGQQISPERWVKLQWQDQLTLGGVLSVSVERTFQLFVSHSDRLFKDIDTALGKIEVRRKSTLRSCNKTTQTD